MKVIQFVARNGIILALGIALMGRLPCVGDYIFVIGETFVMVCLGLVLTVSDLNPKVDGSR